MNKEFLQKRILELEGAIQTNVVNHHRLSGALEDCKYWLSELDKKQSPDEIIDTFEACCE